MNELTEKIVFIENDKIVTNSKQVAESFGKQHKDVLENIDNLMAENSAVKMFKETSYESRGRKFRMYLMNRDRFSLLAMGFTGKHALEFKLKYIEAFNQLEQFYNSPDMIIKRAMELQAQKIIKLETENKELKPKALFADSVSTSKTSILVGDMAKIIKSNGIDMGANRFFTWLRDNGYLIKRKGSDWNMPTQNSMNLDLFEIKETIINKPDGHVQISKTPKITGKGQIYFINKFLGA
ncbi:oxidoreductase [Lactococcus hodotermopsidis]|uniref:Oxidoreductase n=1 Tax=Pseudolactococcus hodotermopsidis TaxID=2709157 RepID=A0A6A0BEC6_9LACT|nr:phage regulatory protein/antirepressor Ant [Lactococcus hodotermopsidis]GFH43035.1 oxidoreductase [Lactococcus hodotermopsidis]